MYLGQRNVATLLLSAQQGFMGATMTSPIDASYLADAVIMLRYFESRRRGSSGDFGGEEARGST